MQTINEILNFNFTKDHLVSSANKLIDPSFIKDFENKLLRLKSISDEVGNQAPLVNEITILELIKKFKDAIKQDYIRDDLFSRRELRTLSYNLYISDIGGSSIFQSTVEFEIFLSLINENWKDNFLRGLLDCYFFNWDTLNIDSILILELFINQKLASYNGSNKLLITLKANRKYLSSSNGDLVLGYELVINKIGLSGVTDFLNLPSSWLTYPYFSKVIISYFEKNKSKIPFFIDELLLTLDNHNNAITSKKLISKLIILANSNEFEVLQEIVKNVAVDKIGDPSDNTKWLPYINASDLEKEELSLAKQILNEWITKQFINIFFEKCINDRRRKKFWIKHASKISNFVVYGNKMTKSILRLEPSISKYLDMRFKVTSSNKMVSAFVFTISNYILIEFSDEGYAFVAYHRTNLKAPSLSKNNLHDVDQLRNGNLPMLVRHRDGYIVEKNSEGRLFHKEDWEVIFDYCIKNIIE